MIFLINTLTISRMILGVLIFLLLLSPQYYLLALILFIVASITDYFDGYLARKTNSVSELGEVLDPIADKILITFLLIGISINLMSSYIGFISAVIIAREIWVGALRDFNARNKRANMTKVTFLAKVKTTIQLFTISLYLFGLAIGNSLVLIFADIFLLMSLLVTFYTGIEYTLNTFPKDSTY